MIKRFLQLTRAHTVPLEAVPALYGALLATGEINSEVLMWGLFGVLYHLAGYGHNSVADYKSGFDKGDPNKQHHPLNNGMNTMVADSIVYSLIAGTFIYASWMALPSVEAFLLGMLMAVAGLGYNFYGKRTSTKSILIATAHSLVFAVPYISMGGEYNLVFALSWVFVFLWVVYQISVSGEIKDLETDEENFMKKMGMHYSHMTGMVKVPTRVMIYTSVLGLLMVSISVLVVYLSLNNTIDVLVTLPIIALLFSFRLKNEEMLLWQGEYHREKRLKAMSMIEFTSLCIFVSMLYPMAGAITSATAGVLSIAWVVVFNYIEWGTIISPEV